MKDTNISLKGEINELKNYIYSMYKVNADKPSEIKEFIDDPERLEWEIDGLKDTLQEYNELRSMSGMEIIEYNYG